MKLLTRNFHNNKDRYYHHYKKKYININRINSDERDDDDKLTFHQKFEKIISFMSDSLDTYEIGKTAKYLFCQFEKGKEEKSKEKENSHSTYIQS